MTVRSARLGVANCPAGATTTVYTCPAGRTAIVKDFRVANTSAGASSTVVQAASGAVTVWLFGGALAGSTVLVFTGFVVLEPGDRLQVFSGSTALQAWVSGAELDGLAP